MESRKALARKKDNDVLKDMVGRAKSLKVIPEELSLLVHRIAHGDPPAKGDSELDTKETLQDPRRLSSQIRWVKYGSFPFWPGRFFPKWVREIGIYCTCWWYSLCNFQYRQHYENTFSYNFEG
jgi:hypothetical protein